MRNFRYIFANCYQGQRKRGVERAFENIQHHLNDKKIILNTSNFVFIKNEYFNNNKGYAAICKFVNQGIKNGQKPLVVGGDHSISIGSVFGSLKYYGNDLTTIWVDAHADINTTKSSPSGNLHGMPLAIVTGIDNEKFQDYYGPKMELNKIMYFGLRDLDPFENKILDESDIQYMTAKELNDDKPLDSMILPTNKVHLSIDVDVLDPSIMSSTGTPVPGGINLNKLKDIYKWINTNADIVSMDLVEYNPDLSSRKCDLIKSDKTYRKIVDMIHK